MARAKGGRNSVKGADTGEGVPVEGIAHAKAPRWE